MLDKVYIFLFRQKHSKIGDIMNWRYSKVLLIAALYALSFCSSLTAADKIKIEKLDDLPRYTYQIDMTAVEFVQNDDAVFDLVSKVKKDLLSDLDKYEINDKTTLKNYYGSLGTIALLEGEWERYLELREMRLKLEEKEAVRLTSGIYSLSYIAAVKSGNENFEAIMAGEMRKIVNTLPYDIVSAIIKSNKGRSEIISESLLYGSYEASIQPVLDGANGEMSKDIALSLIGGAYTLRNYIPYKHIVTEVFSEYLEANAVEKEDIWEERDFDLPDGQDDVIPAVIAIWDSGVDYDIYNELGVMWTNKSEIPGNGKDDDNNGYIDDIHGIAYNLKNEKTPRLLYPIGDVKEDRPRLQRLVKGLEDINACVESEEASELKKALSSLKPEQVQPFIEDISKYGNYAHGTHVAGITAHGNPYIKLLATRLTFGHTMIPELPTIENAHREAKMYKEVVQYYKENNVRAVNMSWGGSVAGIESALEDNNAGGTPDERKELAREIFEIGKKALLEAIKSAPEILFVTSAGNSDNDVNFEEFIPSSFDLQNIISIGAVDQAGDETDFTSFGKVDVYANGFEVESYVPGGDHMKMSGTSMSSPNVTNLAAKIFVANPELTALQVRDLIITNSDEKKCGDRSVLLIHPKKTIMSAAQVK
jgi:Subtilase family